MSLWSSDWEIKLTVNIIEKLMKYEPFKRSIMYNIILQMTLLYFYLQCKVIARRNAASIQHPLFNGVHLTSAKLSLLPVTPRGPDLRLTMGARQSALWQGSGSLVQFNVWRNVTKYIYSVTGLPV